MRDAYHWIQQTKQAGGFRGRVYGPILLEVECHNPLHTSYLENQVGSKGPKYRTLSLHTLFVVPAACAKLMCSCSADFDKCGLHLSLMVMPVPPYAATAHLLSLLSTPACWSAKNFCSHLYFMPLSSVRP